jgi:HPt (histidine-containing phosphotransfer) domain-containing protein
MGVMEDSLTQIDPKVVAELRRFPTRGSADLFVKLVGLFEISSAEALAQLQTALQVSATGQAAAICHRFKSIAGSVGAVAFAREVGRIERHCVEGDLARARELLGELQAAYPTLLAELARS